MTDSNRPYQICSRCIMDTSDPEIVFDEQGICNHCHQYEARARRELFDSDESVQRLEKLVAQIRREGQGKEYDCILGISGGADSSYLAYLAKQLGLRPLAIHFDNGWNSELAVDNIKKLLSKLEIDLYTYVVDWDEFCDLQKSFLKSSAPNAEIPTDHAINAVLWNQAARHGVRYILSGSNLETEGVMPLAWTYTALDLFHIRAVHRRFGTMRLKTFPHIGLLQLLYYVFVRKIRVVNLLNLAQYHKAQAIGILEQELGWRPYGQKHHESVWTRYYQGAFLVDKYGFDKRRPHLSTLILSGQINREQALERLETEKYPEKLLRQDYEFVLKKFSLTDEDYARMMQLPPKAHTDYPNLAVFYLHSTRFIELLRKFARAA